jgi:hypothetical protein
MTMIMLTAINKTHHDHPEQAIGGIDAIFIRMNNPLITGYLRRRCSFDCEWRMTGGSPQYRDLVVLLQSGKDPAPHRINFLAKIYIVNISLSARRVKAEPMSFECEGLQKIPRRFIYEPDPPQSVASAARGAGDAIDKFFRLRAARADVRRGLWRPLDHH